MSDCRLVFNKKRIITHTFFSYSTKINEIHWEIVRKLVKNILGKQFKSVQCMQMIKFGEKIGVFSGNSGKNIGEKKRNMNRSCVATVRLVMKRCVMRVRQSVFSIIM